MRPSPSLPSPSPSPTRLPRPGPRRYPNLLEVRTIPGRRNIAFVEFEDESSSAVARDALHNTKFGTADDGTTDEGLKIKVTFAKKG